MPNSQPRRIPKYRHYKPKDLGVVRINGFDEYLGKYNSPESLERYHRRVAEWLNNGQGKAVPSPIPEPNHAPLTIDELILRYWHFATVYYSKEGRPTRS